MIRSTFIKLTALYLASTSFPTVSANPKASRAADAVAFFERSALVSRDQGSCAKAGYVACNKNGLPGNFCCPSDSQCVAFNNNKSAICCPSGSDCSKIQPINCDINQQNPAVHPSSQLYTTDLNAKLESCGSSCCPQGYSCKEGQCVVASGTSTASSAPSSAAASSSSSSTPSSSPISSKSAQATSSASSASNSASHSASATAQPHCSQFPAAGVLVGFFSGLAIGIILTILVICCFGHYRRKKEDPPPSPDFTSSVTANVSDPIYQDTDGNAFRSDFLRRESGSKQPKRTSKVRSLFSRTPTLRSMRSRDAPVDGIGRSIPPRTPPNQRSPELSLKKEPSMESIKIYSPPNMVHGRPNTTFTDMMADAGFKHGEPYLGSPGRGMPMP